MMDRAGYTEDEVDTALGLLDEAGDPPTEIKTGADVQHRSAWVLGAEVRALRAEREHVTIRGFTSRDGHEHITAPLWAAQEEFDGLVAENERMQESIDLYRATLARVEACVSSAEARPETWSFRDFVKWLRAALKGES